jgi:hypothetical protein
MMVLLHGYLKYTQPLFIQSLMGLKNLYDAKPVAIHLLGQPAEGELQRPFKVAGLFGGKSLEHLPISVGDSLNHRYMLISLNV